MAATTTELFVAGVLGALATHGVKFVVDFISAKISEKKIYKRSAAIVISELEIFALTCTDLADSMEHDGLQNPDIPKVSPTSSLVDLSLFPPEILSRYLSVTLYQKSAQKCVEYVRFRTEINGYSESNINKQIISLGNFALRLASDMRKDADLPRLCIPKNIWDFSRNLKMTHQEMKQEEA